MEFKPYKDNEYLENSYYKIPQELFVSSLYKDRLNSDSKILYAFLLDRLSLSQKNHWIDEERNIYLVFNYYYLQNLIVIIQIVFTFLSSSSLNLLNFLKLLYKKYLILNDYWPSKMDMIKFIHKLRSMTNGERIKYLREKNGFTQEDIETRLGVELAVISKYELDIREPNIEAIKKLATIFNVSIDYLLGRTPDVFVNETDRDTLDISAIKDKYNFTKKKMNKLKEIYKNDTTLSIAINELCCGIGKTT